MLCRHALAGLILAGFTSLAIATAPVDTPGRGPGDSEPHNRTGLSAGDGRPAPGSIAGPERLGDFSIAPTGSPVYRFSEVRSVAARYRGEDALRGDFASGLAVPTTLSAGDLDEDGVPDLVCGYSGPSGEMVVLYRGNPDAIYASTPAARQRKAAGSFHDGPFLQLAELFRVPATPDFISVGDFDNDGHLDVATAARDGAALHLSRGDGRGGIASTETIELAGRISAMAGGEINRADGLADLVVAVERDGSSALLVFQGPRGALRAEPEILSLPARASGLALAELNNDPVGRDLALTAGTQLLVVHGRDRRLTLGVVERARVPEPIVERIDLPRPARAVAVGNDVADDTGGVELAVLLDDGTLQTMARRASTDPPETPGWVASITNVTRRDFLIADPDLGRLQIRNQAATSSIPAELRARAVSALPLRLNRDALDDIVLLVEGAAAPMVLTSTAGVLLTVQHHGDKSDELAGDGICSTADSDPTTCTLRAAIEEANALAGPDTIDCEITSGSTLIAPESPLPTISDPLTLDATTQAEFLGTPAVEIDGSAGGATDGLFITAGSTVVRGMVIRGFESDGIRIEDNGGNIIEGNFIGTDATGTVDMGNTLYGIRIRNSSSNLVGGTAPGAGNLISGNDIYGVAIQQLPSTGNRVEGNFIGTDVTGTLALGNSFDGVVVFNGPSSTTIGGTAAAARNVISGNGRGVSLWYATASQVQGNLIGTDASGTAALGNTEHNLWIASDGQGGLSHDNLVGGTAANAGNVISAVQTATMIVLSENSWNNDLQGNLVGTDITGTVDLGAEAFHGIAIIDSPDNVVGGVIPEARNVISGNAVYGVSIWYDPSTGNQVLGNYIGTDVSGTARLPNDFDGVHVRGGASDNVIGGTEPGARNLLSGNEQHGISIWDTGATGNQVLGNYIGLGADGTTILHNLLDGVSLSQGASANFIGGAEEGAGNVVSGNQRYGVVVWYADSVQNQILGNLVGTDATGTVDLGNAFDGIIVRNETSGNVVGGTTPGAGNLVSGNFRGVTVANGTANRIEGNFIGTDVTGTASLPNASFGVWITEDTVGPSSNNVVGGTDPGAGNLISGNEGAAVRIDDGCTLNEVQGNLIGTDVSGAFAIPNYRGVNIVDAPDNAIGGTEVGARNVISGNTFSGIRITGGAATGNSVQGNYIGTDWTGGTALPNLDYGVNLEAPSNVIGGEQDGAGNVISANTFFEVYLRADLNRVQGNLIGLDAAGTTPLGTGLAGVYVTAGSFCTIGGTTAGAGNIISGAGTGAAVQILDGTGHSVLGNSIFGNEGLGIDLAVDGVTANDPGDPDSGANDLQNYPVPTSAVADPGGVTVEGTLDSTASTEFRLEFFSSAVCDGSGHGEGERYLGFTNVTTDGTGIAGFNTVLPGVSDLDSITATATNPDGSTSEFSACVTASCSSLAVFSDTVKAPDKNTLAWLLPDDIRYVRGDLGQISSCVTTGHGTSLAATTVDISLDDPAPGTGFFYVVRPLACGNWETTFGAEPGRVCLE